MNNELNTEQAKVLLLSKIVLFSRIEEDDEIETSEASSMWKVEIDVVLVCILAASGG